jgi:hypothetical protein
MHGLGTCHANKQALLQQEQAVVSEPAAVPKHTVRPLQTHRNGRFTTTPTT